MGIVAICPNGHRIKVKDNLAGRKGICPTCAARFRIPTKESQSIEVPRADAAAGLPAARVVSLDPVAAAALPAAFALDEADTVGAVGPEGESALDAVDFALVAEEPPATTAPADEPAGGAPSAADARPPHPALDERPELAWCVALRGGDPSALLDAAAMRAWLDSGAASTNHVVWRQDWPDWRPLGDVFPDALPPEPPGRP